MFHIFERLNTGGTRLNPQEIRTAVFRGKIVEKLKMLNSNATWQKVLGLKQPDKYQKDIELVLRLLSLYRNWSSYEKPMKEYLNNAMKQNAPFDTDTARGFEEQFAPTLNKVVEALGEKPFRPKGVINAAVLEAVMVTLLENSQITTAELKIRYDKLIADPTFSNLTSGATTDTKVVTDRLKRTREVLAG